MSLTSFFSRRCVHWIQTLRWQSQCPFCLGRSYNGLFCSACAEDLYQSYLQQPQRCPDCGRPLQGQDCIDCLEHKPLFSRVEMAFDYIAPADSLVLRFKNSGQAYLSQAFADLLYQHLVRLQRLPTPGTLLIPIPGSQHSLQKRAYNPATEFAKSLGKKLQCPLDLSILRRTKRATEQKSLSRPARLLNTGQLYYCRRRLHHPRVILVDDIMTSGSTLNSATRALMAAGVERVDVIVIARACSIY